ncbi:MAG: alpha-amylase family glycosyl hydrolase [Candidatus Melainabacteria bacterium]|nr:alpha-amylase family glycosyl hydrolase [Candidatus Melainabacteria bacterium]
MKRNKKSCFAETTRSVKVACLMAATLLLAPPAMATDFKNEVVYQVFTDRFCNGDTKNDDPEISKGLFDPTRTNWGVYWGGDLDGVRQKLDYIQGLGATAIWISPVIDCIDKVIQDGSGKVQAPYHGYHGRDFKKIDEHFGDADKSWKPFDALIEEAHKRGIKVMVDIPLNHTSEYNHGEFGAFWDDGHFKGDTENDRSKYFNHQQSITDYNDRYQLQYGVLAYLGDFNQENEFVDRYLRSSAEKFLEHGADATRLDAAKHANWGWQQSLANTLFNKNSHFVVAEWWLNDTKEPLYRDAVKFTNNGGMSMFDFAFANAIRKVLGSKEETDFKLIDEVIEKEYQDFTDANGLVTFIDNHDMPRFLSLNDNKDNLNLALALLMTSRGTPSIYYGTEQYLHDDTKGGVDPYTRAWMTTFDQEAPCYKLIKELSDLRKSNPAFAYGRQKTLHVSKNCYVFERRFGENLVVVAINKDPAASVSLADVKLSLPAGTCPDSLGGALNGDSIDVASDGVNSIELKPSAVAVWCVKSKSKSPLVGSVYPYVINGGGPVTIRGTGFGTERGALKIGTVAVDVSSWSDDKIVFNAPHVIKGSSTLTVSTAGGASSEAHKISFVEGKLIPIRLAISNAPIKSSDQQVFISGNVFSLGNGKKGWMEAAGPMLLSEDRNHILVVPLPASQKVEFKMMILDKDGNVVAEETKSHSYRVPETGVWTQLVKWE